MNRKTYIETFDDGPGGWLGWMAGGGGPRRLTIENGAAHTQPPWGVDINHAPPGAGYLHLPYVLTTRPHRWPELSSPHRFVEGGYSTDLTNARFSVRIRGEMDMKGAEMLLLVQTDLPREAPTVRPNMVLKHQPIEITRQWSEQTLILEPDPEQWLCMGTRGRGADCPFYGCAPIDRVLRDVNINIILVIFGLDIAPAEPIAGDPHVLRAGKDYKIDESRLPSGYILLDTVRIEYP
jgi:hypothetical protein